MVAKPTATFPCLIAHHQALPQARVLTRDPQPSVASSQDLHGRSSNERIIGIFPLRGAAPDASPVRQQPKETKQENDSLKQQINVATKTLGVLQQHSWNLIRQLQREVSRSQRLEHQLIDCSLPQFEAIGSVGTDDVCSRTCTAEVSFQGMASLGATDTVAIAGAASSCICATF